MALVLRKAALPKNVSFLKCVKGRTLATTANVKTAAPLSKIVPWRQLKEECKLQLLGATKVRKSTLPTTSKRSRCGAKNYLMRFCVSCPNLVPESRKKLYILPTHFSPSRSKTMSRNHIRSKSSLSSLPTVLFSPQNGMLKPNLVRLESNRSYSAAPCNCGCPCPLPCGPYGCGGCGCLPPPCNVPPKCVQYMTGYYYYPYGWWFCGPYHVAGTCAPVGPCSPGGPCGPCKCPAACICPDTSAVFGGKQASTPEKYSSNIINSPLTTESQKQSRSSISKFFPFNSNMTPTQTADCQSSTSTKGAPKPKSPPFMSSLICFPYEAKQNNASCKHTEFNTPYNLPNNNNFSTAANPVSRAFQDSTFNNRYNARHFSHLGNNERKEKYKSSIGHKRPKRYICDNLCPSLKQPRVILTREQRDKPRVKPGAFDYSSVPNYKSPYLRQTFDGARNIDKTFDF